MNYYLLPSRASGKQYMLLKHMFDLLERGNTITVVKDSKCIPPNRKNMGDVNGKAI